MGSHSTESLKRWLLWLQTLFHRAIQLKCLMCGPAKVSLGLAGRIPRSCLATEHSITSEHTENSLPAPSPQFLALFPLLELWRHNWVSEVPKWTLSVRWRENEPDLCLFFIISVFAILKIPLLFVYHTLLSDPFLLFLEFQTH